MGYFVKRDLRSIGGTVLHSGTTAERPATAIEGALRYNTSTQSFEYYNGFVYASISTPGVTQIRMSRITADGVATTFTMTNSVLTPKEALVFVNGVYQEPTTSYTVTGTTLDFGAVVIPSGDLITVVHGIGDNFITASQATDIT